MRKEERRIAKRLRLRLPMQFERVLSDGNLTPPAAGRIREFSVTGKGFSFYSQDKLETNMRIRVHFSIADDDAIEIESRIVHVLVSESDEAKYVIGVANENLNEEQKTKLVSFLDHINMDSVIGKVPLGGVMDVHFMVGYPPVLKKIGALAVAEQEPFDAYTLKVLLLSMLDDYRYRKFKDTRELNFVYNHPNGSRFRANYHVQQGYVEAIFRVIPGNINSPSQLGLPDVVEKLILSTQRGLIMVAGRTGSGKTTTCASMIEVLNSRSKDKIIICIEDPIEYIHTNETCYIKQREVGRDTISFYTAAKNALRQNPDVLLIGEILDAESMDVAITAAETGALVLTTIHAPDSAQALDRIVSFFPADIQKHMLTRLSLVLKSIITQQLVPRADGTGLVVATEVMVVTNPLKRVIRDGDFKQIPSLVETGREAGMQPMVDSLMKYYEKGIIDGGYLKGYL